MSEKTTRKGRHSAEPASMPEPKKAYIFFNCDEEKNDHTKNIFYNHEVFCETQKSLKALWTKVQMEVAAGRIAIDEANLDKVRTSILDGDPTEASQYIRCGVIHSFDRY